MNKNIKKILITNSAEYDLEKIENTEKLMKKIIDTYTTSTFDVVYKLMNLDSDIATAYKKVIYTDDDLYSIRFPCFYLCNVLKENSPIDLHFVTAKSDGFTTPKGEEDIGESHSILTFNGEKSFIFDPGLRFPKKILLQHNNVVDIGLSKIQVLSNSSLYPFQCNFTTKNKRINYQFNPFLETINMPEAIYKRVLKYMYAYKMQKNVLGESIHILYNSLNNELTYANRRENLTKVLNSKKLMQELYEVYKLLDNDFMNFIDLLNYLKENRERLINNILDDSVKINILTNK